MPEPRAMTEEELAWHRREHARCGPPPGCYGCDLLAHIAALEGQVAEAQSDRALAADMYVTLKRRAEDAERERDAEHTRAVLALAGWKELERQLEEMRTYAATYEGQRDALLRVARAGESMVHVYRHDQTPVQELTAQYDSARVALDAAWPTWRDAPPRVADAEERPRG